MPALCSQAQLPGSAAAAVDSEAYDLGAIHVKEMTPADWQGLSSWHKLKPLEQRRFLAAAANFN
jgi:hypothetical protein